MMVLPTMELSLAGVIEALDKATLWWGLGVGAVMVVIGTVGPQRRMLEPILPAISGIILAVLMATIGSPGRSFADGRAWWAVGASVAVAASSYAGVRVRRGVYVGAALLIAFAAVPAHTTPMFRAAVVLATVALSAALETSMRHGDPPRVFPPMAVVTLGLFLCLPETSAPLTTLGFLIAPALWSVIGSDRGPGTRPPATAALAPPLVMTVILGASTRMDRVSFGALAALAAVAVWAVVRVCLRCRPGPPRIAWPILTVGVGLTAIGIARVAVVRATDAQTIIGSIVGLGALLVWCVAGERIAARHA